MKIVQYMFLLCLLAIIGLAVFVATQKSTFQTSESVFIKVKRSVVFTYLNDYKNWEDWSTYKEDNPDTDFTYPQLTAGVGASFKKKGKNGLETTSTTLVKQNDSICQKVTSDHFEYNSVLKLKDTTGGTILTWTTKGNVDFKTKIRAAFRGGIDEMMSIMFERSLYNLNAILNKEINIFDISIKGIIEKKGGFFIKQTASCDKEDFQNKLQIMLPRMIYFFKNNDIKMNGKPFVIYENRDNDTLQFSVCAPLFEEIFISENSDVQIGFLEPFYGLKTTLTGDYSHLSEAKKKALQYLNTNKMTYDSAKKDMDIFTISNSDVKNPSRWQTNVILPVVYKTAAPTPVKTVITTPIQEVQTADPL